MIIMDPYNPLIHLRSIKNLFRSSPEQSEKESEKTEEPKVTNSTEKEVYPNIDYTSILQDLATLIANYDIYVTQFNDEAAISLIKYLQNSIIDLMIKYGAEEFTDTYYHSLSDIIVPFRIVEEQTPIKKTLRPGLKFNDTIILRSLVEI